MVKESSWPDYPIKGFHLSRIPRSLSSVPLANVGHRSSVCIYCNETACISLMDAGYGPMYFNRPKLGLLSNNFAYKPGYTGWRDLMAKNGYWFDENYDPVPTMLVLG